MALFLAIITPPVTLVVPFLLFANLNGVGVILSCRDIIFLVPFLLLLLKILLSFICAGDFSWFSGLRVEWSEGLAVGLFCFLWPGFHGAGFFDSSSLDLHL